MTAVRTIGVVTGSRAEYGLLRCLMNEIKNDPELELNLFVTGAHLDPAFGRTVEEIETDGFLIEAEIPMDLGDDSNISTAVSVGNTLAAAAKILGDTEIEILVLLGDRYEIFAVASAAMLLKIPIAHLNGGEASEGSMDEAFRHCISKMSHLHFVIAEEYRQKVIQLGEQPDRVFNVGSTFLDGLEDVQILSRKELEIAIDFELGENYFVLTYHPATLNISDPADAMFELLGSLEKFPEFKLLITGVNADPQYAPLKSSIETYARNNPGRTKIVNSLGQKLYFSALTHSAGVVGNSSSGLIEAPAFNIPTINIGNRQKGRIRADSVIDCPNDSDSIAQAVVKSFDKKFRAKIQNMVYPFGEPGSSKRIKETIKNTDLSGILLKKFFAIAS